MAVKNQLAMTLYNPESTRVFVYPEAASQSFKAGQLVYLASGKVTVCADDATVILGMAMQDASGTTDADVLVAVFGEDTMVLSSIYHGTPGSAVTAITDVGVKYGLQVDSNKCYVDKEETTSLAFIVQKIYEGDAVGDQYGRVVAKILDQARQLGYDLDVS